MAGPGSWSWLAGIGTVFASLLAGYLGGVAAATPQVSPDAAHKFYVAYLSELTNAATREQARSRLSDGLRSLDDNSPENYEKFWAEYVSAEVVTLVPTGVPGTFLVNAVYETADGAEWRRSFHATLSCRHPLSRFASFNCPTDDIRLEAAMTVDR